MSGKLKHHPSTRYTADLLLRQLLEDTGKIRAIFVVVEWADKSMDFHHTQAKTSTLCMASRVMQTHVDSTLGEESNCPPDPEIGEGPS